jgi:hypothetical protein
MARSVTATKQKRIASPKALGEVQEQARLLLTKIKFARVRGDRLIQEFSQSQEPAVRAAAKELAPLLPEVLGPLDQAEEALRRIDPLASQINGNNFRAVMAQLDQSITEGLMGFRTAAKQVEMQLGKFRNKNEQVALQLNEALKDRFKRAVQELRQRGMSPEEAGEEASQEPVILKMRAAVEGTKAKIEALDVILHEYKSIFETSSNIVARLKSSFDTLESSLQPRKTAAKHQAQKRLRVVAKRIVLLAYLQSKSL